MANDVIYFVKGFTGSNTYTETYKFDLSVWTSLASAVIADPTITTPSTANPSIQSAWDGQKLYVLLPASGYLRLMAYDSSGNTWSASGLGGNYNFGTDASIPYGMACDGRAVYILRGMNPPNFYRYDIAADLVTTEAFTDPNDNFTGSLAGENIGLAWDFQNTIYAMGNGVQLLAYDIDLATWSDADAYDIPANGINKLVYTASKPWIFNFESGIITAYYLDGSYFVTTDNNKTISTPAVRWDKGAVVTAIDENTVGIFLGGSTTGHTRYLITQDDWNDFPDNSPITFQNGSGAYAVPITMTSMWYEGDTADSGDPLTTEADFGEVLIGDTYGPMLYQWKANRDFPSGVKFDLNFPAGSDLSTVTFFATGTSSVPSSSWVTTLDWTTPVNDTDVINLWVKINSVEGTNQPASHKRFSLSMEAL